MVEVVIVLAIVVLIASLLLASFPRLSQGIAIQRAAQELALSLRRAQSMALAVRQVDAPTGRRTPGAYGVYLNRVSAPGSYVIFADLRGAGGAADGRYVPADDAAIETVALGPGISAAGLISDLGGAEQRQDILNITFSVPEARMGIQNASLGVGESAEVRLESVGAAYRRNVVVRTSGQITTR